MGRKLANQSKWDSSKPREKWMLAQVWHAKSGPHLPSEIEQGPSLSQIRRYILPRGNSLWNAKLESVHDPPRWTLNLFLDLAWPQAATAAQRDGLGQWPGLSALSPLLGDACGCSKMAREWPRDLLGVMGPPVFFGFSNASRCIRVLMCPGSVLWLAFFVTAIFFSSRVKEKSKRGRNSS